MLRKIMLMVMVMVMGLLAGCGGTFKYLPPDNPQEFSKQFTVDQDKRVVWDKILLEISETHFVINNLEYDSGFINLSFGGGNDLVDCGCYEIESISTSNNVDPTEAPTDNSKIEYVKITSKELLNKSQGVFIVKKNYVNVNGRANILVVERDNKTHISFSLRYVVTISRVLWSSWDGHNEYQDFNVAFNSGTVGLKEGIKCVSTGVYESQIIRVIKRSMK